MTGGAGFIGCALSQKLAELYDRWVVLDSLHPQVHATGERPADLHDSAELVVGDVTDAAVWDHVLESVRPSVIIHLAAETGTAQSLHEASRHAQVNVVGTTQMLDALGRANQRPAHIVLSSSRAVYGEGRWENAHGDSFQPGQRSHAQFEAGLWDFVGAHGLPSVAAETVPAPTSVYGATKIAQENILAAWGGSHDVRVSILRLQNVYGPGQSLINSYTGIVTLFSQWARDGKTIPLYEDGQIVRDFVFIDDVADAFVAVLKRESTVPMPVLDVGSGVATTIAQLAQAIADYYGAPTPVVNGAYRDGDVRYAACTIRDTLRELDWAPQWSVERGLAALQDWIGSELKSGAGISRG
ncbi:NAD-dependent epimerase/dehydratase family protein [Cryobacterium serini]|uniref:NAD-dependent epimerase/dehydratase family protein n=1 Tax=Cryobacterium serini TaxID=1259201 RepID=UPI0024087469|nr:NAD-dependent epimerase/dehydratase family protein [Cryobacterium serini]